MSQFPTKREESRIDVASTRQFHDSFASMLSAELSGYLKSDVEVTLKSIEREPLITTFAQTPSAFIAVAFPLRYISQSGTMQIDLNSMMAVMEHITGARTTADALPGTLNQLQRRLAGRIIKRILNVYRKSMRGRLDIDAKLEPILEIGSLDNSLCARYQLRLLGAFGFLNVCLPDTSS